MKRCGKLLAKINLNQAVFHSVSSSSPRLINYRPAMFVM